MALLSARLASGETVAFKSAPVGKGGEKLVFLSDDCRLALSFYRDLPHISKDRHDRARRLNAVLGRFNLTAQPASATAEAKAALDFWRNHFCWPTALLADQPTLPESFFTENQILRPVTGFVSPAFPSHMFFKTLRQKKVEKKGDYFFSHKVIRSLVPPEERGEIRALLIACAKIARAFRRLHQSGLAHGDISGNNILVSPRHGDAYVLDLDGLVVPGVAKPTVIGTPGWIAPEVLKQVGRTSHETGTRFEPNIATDRHQLAVYFYRLLLHRHPLTDGKKVHAESPEEHDFLAAGPNALFVEHPTDRSNALPEQPAVPLARLGPYLQKLFYRTFVDGLHQPDRRADAGAWEMAFYQTLDLLHPTPDRKDYILVAPDQPKETFAGNQKISWTVPVGVYLKQDASKVDRPSESRIVLYDGKPLYLWNCFTGMAPDEAMTRPFAERAKCVFDRRDNRFKLVNQGDQPFLARVRGGVGETPVPPGHAVQLKNGLTVQLGSAPLQPGRAPRVIHIQLLDPPHFKEPDARKPA